jgi:hypothetical protein
VKWNHSEENNQKILVQHTIPSPIITRPNNTFTVALRVANLDTRTQEFMTKIELPMEWKRINEDSIFKVQPGQETIRLISIFVPIRALAGIYPVAFIVQAKDDPSIKKQLLIDVEVLLQIKLKNQLLQSPKMVIAGKKYQADFLITNFSNGIHTLDLEIISDKGFSYHCETEKLHLEPGESRPLSISVKTDPQSRKNTNHILRLIAKAKGPDQKMVHASSLASVEVIPKESGDEDYFHRLPTEIKFIGLAHKDSNSIGQVEFSGSGSAEDRGIKRIDFAFRGPDSTELLKFGFFREEYRLSLETSRMSFNLGDSVFFLSKLSEYGHYGRGVEGIIKLSKFSLKAYYQESLFINPKRKQKAVKVSYKAGKWGNLSFNYLTNKEINRPEDKIFSFQTQFFSKPLNLNLEFAFSQKAENQDFLSDKALWIELSGNLKKAFGYQLYTIRSGVDYAGSYTDLIFNSGRFSLNLIRNFGLRAAYSDLKRNIQSNPSLSARKEQYMFFGTQLRFLKAINLSVDYRNTKRQALFPEPLFDYEDRTIRIGLSPIFGAINFSGHVDIGVTHNSLTGKKSNLLEYNASGNFNLFRWLSFGGYFQIRDQDKDFTGDKERTKNLNFNLRLNFGKTNLYVFYRTSWYHEFYNRILFDQSLVEKLLFSHLNFFEVSFAHTLANGHSIALRMRHASNSMINHVPDEDIIGLLEYSIPIGFPVSRKTGLGELRGRVFDHKDSKRGIAGVILKVNSRSTVSNRNGQFTFHGLKAGSHSLYVDEVSLGPNRIPVIETPMNFMIEEGRRTSCNIGITKGAVIQGKIIVYGLEDKEVSKAIRLPQDKKERKFKERHPLANTLLQLKNGKQIHHRITDENGVFRFDGLKPGKYTLNVFDNNLPDLHYLEKDRFEFELTPGDSKKVIVRILPKIREIKIIKNGKVPLRKNKYSENGDKNHESTEISNNGSHTKKADKATYFVQISACIVERYAEAIRKRFQNKYRDIFIIKEKSSKNTFHKVRIKAQDKNSALRLVEELKELGFDPFILKETESQRSLYKKSSN